MTIVNSKNIDCVHLYSLPQCFYTFRPFLFFIGFL